MKPGASRVPKPGEPNNARTEKEVVYPFGVQNDLGHVVLTRNSKSSREDGRGDGCPGPPSQHHQQTPVQMPGPVPLPPPLPPASQTGFYTVPSSSQIPPILPPPPPARAAHRQQQQAAQVQQQQQQHDSAFCSSSGTSDIVSLVSPSVNVGSGVGGPGTTDLNVTRQQVPFQSPTTNLAGTQVPNTAAPPHHTGTPSVSSYSGVCVSGDKIKSVTPPPPLPPLSPCLPPAPPEPELLSPRVLTASVSHLSLQSSRHNRFHSGSYAFHRVASSLSDLSYDAAILERAIRTNDVARVKKCFEKHRHRFQFAEKTQQTSDEESGHPTHTNKTSASASTGQNGCCASTSSAVFTSTSCNAGTSQGAGTSCGGGGGMGTAGAGSSSQAKQSRTSEYVGGGDAEENPMVFTNAIHLAVEWGANDVLRFFLRENVDPNKPGRLPDAYDISAAGSRSASVSAWGSGCVFCPPSPRNISRDVSPSREHGGRIFSRNSSRNVSTESSRCVSPCRERLWSVKTEPGGSGGAGSSGGAESRAHLRREAFKNLSSKNDDKTESSTNGGHGEQDYPAQGTEGRPIISVVYCASEERRRSSGARQIGEITLPGSESASGIERDPDEWGTGPQGRRINRRVSWVSSLREPTDKSRMTLASRLKRQKLRLPRQRSFSLESELELRTVAKRAVGVAGALQSIREARRSISLKSSPLHFPWSFRRESSSAMREGGVFAELRRSSEIFRNILLSIAGRDESTPTDDDQYEGLEGKDLSFSSLLAAHGRRRSERSVSYSSCSWSDVSIGSETLPRRPLSVNPSISKGLLVVSVESRGREVTFVEHYTSSHLMTLPPIFLAASRGRSTPVVLLLQHGAKGNIADSLGNTPLHLAVIQSPTPWDVILDLMEGGSRIFVRNERGIAPHDLLPPILRLQKELVADCWLGLVLEDAAHMIEQSEQGGARDTASRSSRLFKKLHEARYHRDKNSGDGGGGKGASGLQKLGASVVGGGKGTGGGICSAPGSSGTCTFGGQGGGYGGGGGIDQIFACEVPTLSEGPSSSTTTGMAGPSSQPVIKAEKQAVVVVYDSEEHS